MPNYIVNTPQFNPIDFETRIKPMAAYIDTFNKQMDALDDAGVLGDTIGGLIDPNKDAELMNVYNSYNTLLGDTVDSMLNTGDVSTSRNNLRALKKKYANELVPIQQGYNAWQEAIKNYDAAVAKDDTFIGTDPRKYSISNYMRGSSPSDHHVSGNTLYSMGMKDAAAASARHIVQGDWKLDPNLLNQYFSRTNIAGWSQDDINEALLDNIIAQKGSVDGINEKDLNTVSGYILNAYNRIADSSNIDAFDDDDNYNRAGSYIINGIMAGLSYDEKSEKADNKGYLDALQLARLEGERLDNEYKRIRNNDARNPKPPQPLTTEEGDFVVDSNVDYTDKKALKGLNKDAENIGNIVESPDAKGYTTGSIMALEGQLSALENSYRETHNYTIQQSSYVPSANFATTGPQANVTTTRYYKYDSNGKKIGEASLKEIREYNNFEAKKKAIQEKIEKEQEILFPLLEKYQHIKTSGMDINTAVNLGVMAGKQDVTQQKVYRTPRAVSTDFSNEKQRFSQMIAETSEANENQTSLNHPSGFFDLNGKKLSEKEVDAIKSLKSDDISSITECLSEGPQGYKVTTTKREKGLPSEFILNPNGAEFFNHNRVLDNARTALSDYSPETISQLQREYTRPTEAVLDVLQRTIGQYGGIVDTPEIANIGGESGNLFVVTYKDFRIGPSKVVVSLVPTANGISPQIIKATSMYDYGQGANGMYQALGDISDLYFNELTAK